MTDPARERSKPYDQAICAVLVRPLVNSPVTPNHVTTVSLLLSLWGSVLFAWGEGAAPLWAAALITVARFIDHMDGELARQSGKSSKFGAFYDSVTGSVSYGTMFLGMGYAEWKHGAPDWAFALAIVTMAFIAINMILQFRVEFRTGISPDPYPRIGRFEVEDGIYLILPIVWLTGTWGLFLVGTVGTLIFTVISMRGLVAELGKPPRDAA